MRHLGQRGWQSLALKDYLTWELYPVVVAVAAVAEIVVHIFDFDKLHGKQVPTSSSYNASERNGKN